MHPAGARRPSLLVAIDGSEAARAAASVGIEIARGQSMAIRGLYVVDLALVMDPYADCQAELGSVGEWHSRTDLIARLQRRGEEVLDWLSAQCRRAGVRSSAEVILGRVPEMVCQRAAEAALLAVGRFGHGHTAARRHLGANFRTVSHRAPCPFVSSGFEARPLRRLLVAYNASERARRVLTWALRLQRSLPADIVVLIVRQSDRDAVEQWAQDARERLTDSASSRCDFVVRDGEPVAEILAAAAESKADCVLMGGYRHTAAVGWLVSSTTKGVLKRLALPVLVA